MRIVLTFNNKQGVEVSIPLIGNDVIHQDGSVTLGPTRIDGKEVCRIQAYRVIGYTLKGNSEWSYECDIHYDHGSASAALKCMRLRAQAEQIADEDEMEYLRRTR